MGLDDNRRKVAAEAEARDARRRELWAALAGELMDRGHKLSSVVQGESGARHERELRRGDVGAPVTKVDGVVVGVSTRFEGGAGPLVLTVDGSDLREPRRGGWDVRVLADAVEVSAVRRAALKVREEAARVARVASEEAATRVRGGGFEGSAGVKAAVWATTDATRVLVEVKATVTEEAAARLVDLLRKGGFAS